MGQANKLHRYDQWRRKYGMPKHGATVQVLTRPSSQALAIHELTTQIFIDARIADSENKSSVAKS